jgi:hypothetical protein
VRDQNPNSTALQVYERICVWSVRAAHDDDMLGLAAFAVAVGLREVDQLSRSTRVGFGLLVIGALFVCLAGVFKEFTLRAAAGLPSVVMAALLLSWSFRKTAGWQQMCPAMLLIALGMLTVYCRVSPMSGCQGYSSELSFSYSYCGSQLSSTA